MLLMFSWQPFYLFFILFFSFWQCLACLVLKPKLGCRSAWLQIPSYTFVLLLIFNIPTQPLSERKKKKKKKSYHFTSRLQAILSLYLESKNWWGLKIYIFFSKNSFLSFNPLSEPNLRFLLTKKIRIRPTMLFGSSRWASGWTDLVGLVRSLSPLDSPSLIYTLLYLPKLYVNHDLTITWTNVCQCLYKYNRCMD